MFNKIILILFTAIFILGGVILNLNVLIRGYISLYQNYGMTFVYLLIALYIVSPLIIVISRHIEIKKD